MNKNKKKYSDNIELEASKAKVIAFDLNKTIADIEGPAQKEILEELAILSQTKKIVIASGFDLKGLNERFLNVLPKSFNKANLFFITSNGAQLISFDELGQETELYINGFKEEKLRNDFKNTFYEMIKRFNNQAKEKGFEEISLNQEFDDKYDNKNSTENQNSFRIDWRDAQITFKGIVEKQFDEKLVGDIKSNWDDEEKSKRKFLIQILEDILKEKGLYYKDYKGKQVSQFSFVAGGSTSIDINKTSPEGDNITKAEGLEYIAEKFGISINEMAYFGDDMKNNDAFARKLAKEKGLIAIEVDGIVGKTDVNGISEIQILDTLSKVKNITSLILKKKLES